MRWSRWVLAPLSTLRLWRRMVLWETRSYSEALRRERDRVLALPSFRTAGASGRGAGVPRAVLGCSTASASWRRRMPCRPSRLTCTDGRPGERGPAASTQTERKQPRAKADVSELTAAGRAVANELAGHGVALTRGSLAERLRAKGVPVSNARLSALLAELRTGTAGPTTEGVA